MKGGALLPAMEGEGQERNEEAKTMKGGALLPAMEGEGREERRTKIAAKSDLASASGVAVGMVPRSFFAVFSGVLVAVK